MVKIDPDLVRIAPPPPPKEGGETGPKKHARGGLWIPSQIMARYGMHPVSPNAWAVLSHLIRKTGNRTNADGTITLTNYDMAKCKVFFRRKRSVLDELAAHDFLTYTRNDRANPHVTLNRHLLK